MALRLPEHFVNLFKHRKFSTFPSSLLPPPKKKGSVTWVRGWFTWSDLPHLSALVQKLYVVRWHYLRIMDSRVMQCSYVFPHSARTHRRMEVSSRMFIDSRVQLVSLDFFFAILWLQLVCLVPLLWHAYSTAATSIMWAADTSRAATDQLSRDGPPACLGLGRKVVSFTTRLLQVPGKDSKLLFGQRIVWGPKPFSTSAQESLSSAAWNLNYIRPHVSLVCVTTELPMVTTTQLVAAQYLHTYLLTY